MAGFVAAEMERVSGESKVSAYKAFKGMLRDDPPKWDVDPEKLKLPVLGGESGQAEDEPYQLKMDRLNEIIRGDKK